MRFPTLVIVIVLVIIVGGVLFNVFQPRDTDIEAPPAASPREAR